MGGNEVAMGVAPAHHGTHIPQKEGRGGWDGTSFSWALRGCMSQDVNIQNQPTMDHVII